MRTFRIKYGSPTRSSSPGNFESTDITVGVCWRKPCGYTRASYGGSGNGNIIISPPFGDDSVVAIDSDITNEAGLLLEYFRGMVDAFLKKAYLVIRDEPGSNFASFPERSFNVGWTEIFHWNHESEWWLARQRSMTCRVHSLRGSWPPWVWR